MTGRNTLLTRLTRALAAADDSKLRSVVAIIDRQPGHGALDCLIAPHRSRLARLKPPRPLTLERVLTLPLEPALVAEEEWIAGAYRIPRSHLRSLHGAVREGLEPDLIRWATVSLEGKTSLDAGAERAVGRRLWPAAATVLEDTLASGRASLGELAISLRLATHLLGLGETLVDTFWHLPPEPILSFSGEERHAAIGLLGAAAERGREALALVADLLGTRCHSPLVILEPLLAGDIPLRPQDRRRCADRVVGACLEKLGGAVADKLADEDARPQDVAALVIRVMSSLESLSDVATKLDVDKHALRRLTRRTAELAEQATRRVLKQIKQNFDDDSDSVPLYTHEKAARAITKIRLAAPKLVIASKLDDLLRCAIQRYTTAFDGFLARRRERGQPTGLDEPAIMERLRIIELLFGSPVAVSLWERHSGIKPST